MPDLGMHMRFTLVFWLVVFRWFACFLAFFFFFFFDLHSELVEEPRDRKFCRLSMVWCTHPACCTAVSTILFLFVGPSLQALPRPLFHGSCKWGGHGSVFPLEIDTCPRPIDESATDWRPWTHRPHCINPVDDLTDDPQFCIFSDASFRFGRGISVLTSPEIAADMGC